MESFLTHWTWPRERSIRGGLHGQGMWQQEAWTEHVWRAQHARGGNKIGGQRGGRPHVESGRPHDRH